MPRPVRPALVAPHQSDRLEPNSLVRLDGARVVSSRVDGQAVVAALVDQESRQGSDRVGSKALALPFRAKRDVDRCVLVHRIRLLDALDEADGLAFVFDSIPRSAEQGLHRIGYRLGRTDAP